MPAPAGSYRVVLLTVDRATDAAALEAEIQVQAGRSGGTRAQLVVTTDSSALRSSSNPGDPSTAVVLLSGGAAATTDIGIERTIGDCYRRVTPVLPVFDPSGLPFADQIPTSLYPINGFAWRPGDSPERLAAVVLRLVGLAEDDRRVFLSYRRTDGTAMANQLRYALADDGWDVFLDKFNVPPGVDFQQRLDRELADKAFVLLLETPQAAGSPWVEHEVAFALRRRLALMALTSPDTSPAEMYGSIDPAFRRQIGGLSVTGGRSERKMTQPELESVLQAVDERHAAAYAFRREALMYETSDEMTSIGYRVEAVGQWSLMAESGLSRELVLVTARAPEPADVRAADALRQRFRKAGFRTRGWVVHPTEDIDEDRASLLRWLCRRRLVRPSPVMLLAGRIGA